MIMVYHLQMMMLHPSHSEMDPHVARVVSRQAACFELPPCATTAYNLRGGTR